MTLDRVATLHDSFEQQARRNALLLEHSPTLGDEVRSQVLPFRIDLGKPSLSRSDADALAALEKTAARIAIESLMSLAKVNDIDHLGGGLELIPSLLVTLAAIDYERSHFAIEHGHTSIGYYAALAALGFLEERRVVEYFRRSLDIAGHVSWVPGGTQLGSGRLGVMVPVSTGLALALRARKGQDAFVICHTGDAGWISGQALNGFTGAALHHAPVFFVMHRNGIQLSGTTKKILDKDPRPVVAALGIEIIEIASLHEPDQRLAAYGEARKLALQGRPSLIYPVGYTSAQGGAAVTVESFGQRYGIQEETAAFAAKNKVALDTAIWIPGSLMSFRDAEAMLECLFYVNDLPGGVAHHDGGMKGRDGDRVLQNPLLRMLPQETTALDALRGKPRLEVVTRARPAAGTKNLVVDSGTLAAVDLPKPGKWVTPRVGSELAYATVAQAHPGSCFFISCDLNPSTKLGKAAGFVPRGHQIEMGIQEQAASLMANGLAFARTEPQLNVFATFTAFLEGIAREGFEFWRYQRNLNGRNEGLNVTMHLAHVGACTGRDHFSGWSLDWINLALGYLPFLRRFYAPADARSAFLAVVDAASATGGHIVAIPRDNLPILTKAGSDEPVWQTTDAWTPVTTLRQHAGARKAIVAVGAPAFVAVSASDKAEAAGLGVDVHVVNGFPVEDSFWEQLARYEQVLTIEDGLIGSPSAGPRGFAAVVAGRLYGSQARVRHFGIIDPQVAPSEAHLPVWEHFGMTDDNLLVALMGS